MLCMPIVRLHLGASQGTHSVPCQGLTTMAHPDLAELLNEALDAAEQFLDKIGEFFPFVVTMSPDGEISHAQEHLGEDPPAANETLDVLLEGLKKAAAKGKYKATALVSDAHDTP